MVSNQSECTIKETLRRIAERALPTFDHSLLREGKDNEIQKKKPKFDRD